MNEIQQDLHGLELESMSQLDPVGIKSVRRVLLLLKAWGMPKELSKTTRPGFVKINIAGLFESLAFSNREPTFQVARPAPF